MRDISVNNQVFPVPLHKTDDDTYIYGPVNIRNSVGAFFYCHASNALDINKLSIFESDDKVNWDKAQKDDVVFRSPGNSPYIKTVGYCGNKSYIRLEASMAMDVQVVIQPQFLPDYRNRVQSIEPFKLDTGLIVPDYKGKLIKPKTEWTPDFDCVGVELPEGSYDGRQDVGRYYVAMDDFIFDTLTVKDNLGEPEESEFLTKDDFEVYSNNVNASKIINNIKQDSLLLGWFDWNTASMNDLSVKPVFSIDSLGNELLDSDRIFTKIICNLIYNVNINAKQLIYFKLIQLPTDFATLYNQYIINISITQIRFKSELLNKLNIANNFNILSYIDIFYVNCNIANPYYIDVSNYDYILVVAPQLSSSTIKIGNSIINTNNNNFSGTGTTSTFCGIFKTSNIDNIKVSTTISSSTYCYIIAFKKELFTRI